MTTTNEILTLRPEFCTPQKGSTTGGARPAGGPGPSGPADPGDASTIRDVGGGGAGGQAQKPTDCLGSMWPILIMLPIFYFLLIRPQQKQEKARQAMVAALKKGDDVVTNSGLHGRITKISDNTVTLSVDKDVTLTFDRSAIQRSGKTETAS